MFKYIKLVKISDKLVVVRRKYLHSSDIHNRMPNMRIKLF
jgi:hypothetical protein